MVDAADPSGPRDQTIADDLAATGGASARLWGEATPIPPPSTAAGHELLRSFTGHDEQFTRTVVALGISRIEAEAVGAERDRVRAFIRWDNPMMTDPAAVKAVGQYRAMLLKDLDG